MSNLAKAVSMLKSKCHVIPEKYTTYNGAFLFLAFLPGEKNKDQCMNPYYLVDLKTNSAGVFSPAFDLDGFFKATSKMINLRR